MPLPSRGHWKSHKRYSRQNAWDVKSFSGQVRQVAEHEDQEGFNSRNVAGESSHERWNKSKDDAKQHSTQPHHKEASEASKDINGFDFFIRVHLGEGDEDVI